MMKVNWKKVAIFAGGVLFGSAGIKLLCSKDARKVYTHTTAAVLRAKESVMATVTTARECAGDILADAKEINEKRARKEAQEVVEDAAEETAEEPVPEDEAGTEE